MLNVPMGPAFELSAFVLALLYRVTVLLLPPAAAISRLLSSLGLKAMCQVSEAGVSIICIMGTAGDPMLRVHVRLRSPAGPCVQLGAYWLLVMLCTP